MLDENGEEMTDVGYAGDPFRVSIYETNGMFIDAPEVTFTPGKLESSILSMQLIFIRIWYRRFQRTATGKHWFIPTNCLLDVLWN